MSHVVQTGNKGIRRLLDNDAGPQGNSYRFNRTSESAWREFGDAQTFCAQAGQYSVDAAAPGKDDCLSAVSKVGSTNGSTICIPQHPTSYQSGLTDSLPPLVLEGTCGVWLFGDAGQCFPSSELAELATRLANVCTNLNLVTSGSYTVLRSPIARQNDTSIWLGRL